MNFEEQKSIIDLDRADCGEFVRMRISSNGETERRWIAGEIEPEKWQMATFASVVNARNTGRMV